MVLFIAPNFSSFVRNDFEILSKKYRVKNFIYTARKNLPQHLQNQIKLLFWLLVNLPKAKIIYIWFADYHSLLPVLLARLFGKRSFLVIGGYDVAHIPELDYGSFKNPLRAFCARFAMNNVTLNLPVADNLAKEVKKRAPKSRIKTVYTGHSGRLFSADGKKKEPFVLTVGVGDTWQRFKIKGLDFLIEVARRMSKTQFVIVGMDDKVRQIFGKMPENIRFTGWVDQDELVQFYRRAKVYAQFSLREGLPSSVCEAMLCECIPVGSDAGGIPIAIGKCGYIVKDRNLDEAVRAIEQALKSEDTLGKCARRRVVDNFSVERREEELYAVLEQSK